MSPRRQRPRGTPSGVDADGQERIHTLWDELARFEAAENDKALLHFLAAVAGLVDAQNAYWMGAVRITQHDGDPLCGWRPRLVRYLRPLPNDETFTKDRVKALNRAIPDELTIAHARRAGSYRAGRMRDMVSAAWFRGDTYRGYLERGVHDSLVATAPVSPIAEAYYGFLRMRADDPFSEAERDLAYYAIRGLAWFHRQTLLAHGLLAARAPLSPMERRVLALLLTDRPEKLIAAELGLSASTIHAYVRAIFRKFGVSGRQGLTAVWLGRPAYAAAPDVNPPD